MIQITGTIIVAYPKLTGVSSRTQQSWACQEFVIETSEQYPHKMLFRVFGEDKIKKFALQEGKRVKVYADIDAHLYNNKYYNEVSVWRVDPC